MRGGGAKLKRYNKPDSSTGAFFFRAAKIFGNIGNALQIL